MSITDFQHLGLISISIIWAGLLFLILKWKGDVSMSFSQHAAQYKASRLFYIATFLFSLPLLYIFMISWFKEELDLSWLFVFLVTISSISMLIAAVVPETRSWKKKTHRVSAFVMSGSFIPIVVMIFRGSDISIVKFVAVLTLAYMIGASAITQRSNFYHKKQLLLQAMYVASFHITIVTATYVR